jgi:hypothetical protein
MNSLYCAQCGKQLSVIKRGLPKMALVIDVVEPHSCSDELALFCVPSKVPLKWVNEPQSYKFVQSLNELSPLPTAITQEAKVELSRTPGGNYLGKVRQVPMTGTDDLRDRRFDTEVKSTAPLDVLSMIRGMSPSEPAKSIPTESEEPSND